MFKDIVSADIDNVFFSTKEFAKLHTVNGVQLPVIVDEDKLSEMKINSKFAPEIAESCYLLFVKRKDIGYIPAKGSVITFDDREYTVKEVVADEHMLQLTISEVV